MKTSRIAGWGTFLIAGIGLVCVLWQGRRLSALETERARVETAIAHPPREQASTAGVREVRPLSPGERLELMSLRRRVTELSGVKRRMVGVANENAALRGHAISVSNRLANPFPPGWVKRSAARQSGFSTPEAALETFVWALHHRDTNVLFQAVLPETRDGLVLRLENQGPDGLWTMSEEIPGFRILKKFPNADGSVRFEVEIIPGASFPDMTLKVVDGGWRLSL